MKARIAALLLIGLAATPGPSLHGNTTLSVTVHEGSWLAAALSPDRSRLVIDLDGGLWIVPMTGGSAKRITDQMLDARQPSWSPDGTRIAFQGFLNDSWHIYTVNPDGSSLMALTTGAWQDQEPQWSPDGTKIVFSSERSGNFDIWWMDIGSRQLTQLTHDPEQDYYPTWSPNGREVAFVSTRRKQPGVYAVALDGSERLIVASGGLLGEPSWSPDGVKVLFSSVDRGHAVLKLGAQILGTDEDYLPFRASWLSDDEFLYTADGKVKRRSLSRGQLPSVEFSAELPVTRPEYPRKHHEFSATKPNRVLGVIRPVMGPYRNQIAFSALGDIWTMTIGKKPERVTNDAFVDTDPSWSPDGNKLAFSSDRAGGMDVWVRDLRSGREHRISSLPDSEMAPVWSPDSQQIAFVHRTGVYDAELCIATASGEGTPRCIYKGTVLGYPSWAPTGEFITVGSYRAYTGRRREGVNYYTIVPAQGEKATLQVPEEHEPMGHRADGSTLSPDGKNLAFIRDATLYVLPVDEHGTPTGPSRQLTTELADYPTWAGPNQLLYTATDQIKLISLVDGRTRDIPLDLTWTRRIPEGRAVVHAGRLIDGVRPTAQENVDIVIEKNRIVAIEAHTDALHTGKVIDASNLSVIPGLFESHGHILQFWGTALGRIHLAYGITSFRDLGAVPYESVGARETIEAGRYPGPRIFATGYLLDGGRSYYPATSRTPNAKVLDMELERARRLDYDLLKTYLFFPNPLHKRAIEGAHRLGIPATSHEFYPAALFGADSVEHFSAHDRRDQTSSKQSATGRAYEDFVQVLATSGMTVTPTLSFNEVTPALAATPALLRDPRLRLQLPTVVRQLMGRGASGQGGEEPSEVLTNQRATALAIQKAGGIIIAGVDSPAAPFAISLPIELQAFVAAGLTPFEALRTATVNPAKALGVFSDLGTLEKGKLADMVIVSGNPLLNIGDIFNVRTVIKNGEAFTLEQLLASPDSHAVSPGTDRVPLRNAPEPK